MDKKLKQLKDKYETYIPTRLTDTDKQAIWEKINETKQRVPKRKKRFFPMALTAAALVAVVIVSVLMFSDVFNQDIASKQNDNSSNTMQAMDHDMAGRTNEDAATATEEFSTEQPSVATVSPTDDDLTISWQSDNMDRGDHDYDTETHNDLVISKSVTDFERGDVVYFETPEHPDSNENVDIETQQISRIVGLPGETIEIKQGHVYINDEPLNAFYAQALVRGMDENTYFNQDTTDETTEDEAAMRDYFSTNMEPVTVDDDAVFVLGDQWWRSIDSRDFGSVPTQDIIGQVMGYEK